MSEDRYKKFIKKINESYLESKDRALRSLVGSLDLIKKMFPRYGSFLMEFIQNADDAGSSSMTIELTDSELEIKNNGRYFSEKDVDSICDIGHSSKSVMDYIGYLGIGFKSIFMISDGPEIQSGYYSFAFQKDHWPDSEKIPWQIIPIWIDNTIQLRSSKYNTIFKIPLKSKGDFQRIKIEFKEHINSRILLFLRNINGLNIIDLTENYERNIFKSDIEIKKNYKIYEIEEVINDEIIETKYWLVFRETYDVPIEVRNDPLTIDWNRNEVDKREVVIAFNLREDEGTYSLKKILTGTAHFGVYSFLPIKEVPSGLNFIIQADFLTNPGRTDLARESKWNNWLANCVFDIIISKCIPEFLRHNDWKYNFIGVLYTYAGGHEILEKSIKEPLREYLETENVVVCEDGTINNSDHTVIIEEELRKLIHTDDLKEILPDKKIAHPQTMISGISVEKPFTFNASSGLSSEYEQLLKNMAQKKNIRFFLSFYNFEVFKYRTYSSSTLHSLRKQDIILTQDYKLVDSYEARTNLKNIKIPREIKKEFNIVHPRLMDDGEIKSFFIKTLDIEDLTEQDIESLLKSKEIPDLKENWPKMSESEKYRKIRHYKLLYDQGKINEDIMINLSDIIQLKSKENVWKKPEELIFPKNFIPNHIVETLFSIFSSFIDESTPLMIMNSISFLNEDLIKGLKSEDEITSWYKFLKDLGVDILLREKKGAFSEDIGVLSTIYYENQNGKKAKIISEKVGYDIESIDKETKEESYIEVKGSSSTNPNITITAHEFSVLINNDNTYVYVVSDALLDPVITILKGKEIVNISRKDVRFQFSDWNEIKEDSIKLLEL